MIKTTKELIAAMKASPDERLVWHVGNRPAAPGRYELAGVRVYAAAVNKAEKEKCLKTLRSEFNFRSYRLTVACRLDVSNEATAT